VTGFWVAYLERQEHTSREGYTAGKVPGSRHFSCIEEGERESAARGLLARSARSTNRKKESTEDRWFFVFVLSVGNRNDDNLFFDLESRKGLQGKTKGGKGNSSLKNPQRSQGKGKRNRNDTNNLH